MIRLSLEEFTAKRRGAQTTIEDQLRPVVARGVDLTKNTAGWDELLHQVALIYTDLYFQETGERRHTLPGTFRSTLRETLRKTSARDENSVDRITTWLATAILSQVTVQAALDDPEELFLEWVDMGDSDVRPTHRQAAGQTRPIGEDFTVGGEKLRFPGDPTGPIEEWINCRCTVRPVLAEEALVASNEFRDVPTDERKRRADNGTALPDGSFPIANCDDLRNAVQAIGRAKDPAKAKAHIKKRASALGCGDAVPEDWSIEMAETETEAPVLDTRVPWHGVLAPENVRSGDGRRFTQGSLSTRPLPLPLTWQKSTSDGHSGSITVATIEKAEVVDGLMRGSGHFITSAEADEVIGLIAEFGKFGVSVDADESEFELNEDDDTVDFTNARVSGASIVPIPAFAEAWVALGYWDDKDKTEPADEALVAAGALYLENAVKRFEEFVKTEDGPGWLTHPVDTDRLRDYWVSGPGAAKIGWGSPGDFNRCRLAVAEYVKPQHLAGYCANRHYDALGFWPGRPVSADTTPFAAETMELENTEPAEAVSLVASVARTAPAEWFQNPGLGEPTHMTVTDEGRVYGHVAQWGTCHIGFDGVCMEPPRSAHNYAYFLTGQVPLDDGTRAATGPISLGGGHAGGRLGMRAAVSHYDQTSTAVADVTVGEDEHGIWAAGWLRPGTPEEAANAVMASDVSGDWRRVGGGEMELCAVLAVNTGGFSVIRPRIAASTEGQVSLVAAGMVEREDNSEKPTWTEQDAEMFADLVAAAIENRQKRREEIAALAARFEGVK